MDVHSTLAGNATASPGPDPTAGSSSVKTALRYSIEKITTEKEFSNLEADWNRLSKAAGHPNVFMTFDWFRAWNQRFTQEDPNGRRPNVLVLKKDSAVVGISPLISRKVSRYGFGARKLEFVGMEADYNDLVLGDDPTGQIEAIVEFLAQTQDEWDLINLRDIRETGNTIALIEKALSHAGLTYHVMAEQERCPYLPIDAPWAVMLRKFSPHPRHNLRTQQNRLDRMSAQGLRVRIIENPQDEHRLLEKLIALDRLKHVHGKLSQPFIAKYPEVFQSLFDFLGPGGWVYVALMELGDRPLGSLVGFRCGKNLWAYHTAYDRSFSRLSPGTMLVNAVLDYGFSHGYNEYDFLRGEEPYKTRWSTGVHQSYWLRIWSRNWISRAHALVYLDLKPAVERLSERRKRPTLPGMVSSEVILSANPGCSVEPITTEEGLSHLEADWNRLSEAAGQPNVFTTFDWFRAWNQRFTQGDRGRRRPNVLVLKKDGAVVGISPLISRKVSRYGFGARKLEFVGLEADYNDLVLGDDLTGQSEAIAEFLAQTQDQWDLVELRDLRETGNTIALIENALAHAGLSYRVVPEEERCPYLPIDAAWSEMMNRLSRRDRQRFRTQQSRLEQMSGEGLRVRIIENPHHEPGLLAKLIALESQKYVHGQLSPPFVAKYPEVFRSLFDTLGPRGWIYVALMEVGDRPIASIMGFRCGEKLWDFHGASDHSFSRISPGTMLVPALLDYGFSHGYKEYDFLRGEESYKMRWSTGVHQSYWLRIWSKSWIARAHALVYLDLKPAVNRLFGRAT